MYFCVGIKTSRSNEASSGTSMTSIDIKFHSMKVVFVITNRAEFDKMPHYVAFHLDLLCVQMYSFKDFVNK